MKGIDVSKWQGNVIWASVKASGIDFAILKCGGSDSGFYTDPKFEQNYNEAKAVGMPVGAYYFVGSKFISKEDGIADAKRCLDIIKGKSFEYPVFVDVETTSVNDKDGTTQAVIAFCKTLEESGYYCGVYSSDVFGFKDRLDISKLQGIDKWVAKYSSAKPSYITDYVMWQYSDRGTVNGITGYVDLNESFVDYPSIIRNMNGNINIPADPADKDALINRLLDLYSKQKNLLEEMKGIIEECQMQS